MTASLFQVRIQITVLEIVVKSKSALTASIYLSSQNHFKVDLYLKRKKKKVNI